jgi:hypothetical protein
MAENGPPKADISALVAWGYTRPAPGANFRQNRKTLPMPLFRCAVFLLLVLAATVLTGARTAQPPKRPADPDAHATAVNLLTDAGSRLEPGRAPCLETKLWQKGRLGRYHFEAEGRLVTGPEHRLRLELSTHNGRAVSSSLTVSDGISVWQGNRTGDGPWTDLVRIDVKRLLQPWPDDENPLHDGIPRIPEFTGIAPLLSGLRSRMHWSRVDTVRRGGRPFIKLAGAWSETVRSTLALAEQPWPVALPRCCRLYLDPTNLWPHRLEWWGPDTPHGEDVLLLQTEFRDPVIDQVMTPDRCARDFTFPVLVGQTPDPSPETLDRIRQLLAPPISDR